MRTWILATAAVAAASLLATTAGLASTARAPMHPRIPLRPAHGLTGSQFAARTDGLPEQERQRAARDELVRGNVPDSLRRFWPVTLRGGAEAGGTVTATIWVASDYLAIGSDDDFLYMPLTRPFAMEVAQAFDCVLPTRKMVDAIYAQARVHLEPRPLPAGPEMRSNAYYERHQRIVDRQREGIPLGTPLSGHLKDLVLSDRLFDHPDRVAIYGWHRPDGRPIQPLSTVHGVRYADYSHGVRLVWHEAWIDGEPRPIAEALADPRLARALSDEGALRDPSGQLDPQPAFRAAGWEPDAPSRAAR